MIGLILLIVARILSTILLPVSFIYGTLVNLFKWRLGKYYFNVAFSIDQLGNVVCMDLFNHTLIKRRSEHLFGDPDETISSVLGKNKEKETLTWVGRILVRILNCIDPGHVEDSVGHFKIYVNNDI